MHARVERRARRGVCGFHPIPARSRLLLGATLFFALSGLADPVRADDVDVTSNINGTGLNLNSFAGTTARIFPGVTVSNTGTLIGGSFPGVFASTRAWTLTNQGTITSTLGNGVTFNAGGTVNNAGAINANSQGIRLGAGGSVNNLVGGVINAGTNGISVGGGAGTVTNAGTVMAAGVDAVSLTAGGIVTNLAGGLIQAHNQSNAVSVVLGTSRTVINSGTIQSNDSGFATGVSLQNGTLTNNAGGQILGAYNGVWANGSSPTSITNAGLIEASKADAAFGTPGSAIEVDGGGTIVNSGIIRSTSTNGTDVGILFSGTGTITNSGTIASLTGGPAILFQGNGTHTLRLDTGSVLTGNVQGGTGTDNLVLLGTGTEAINKFLSFETLSMQGTDWTLTGAGAFTTSTQVQSGALRVNGQLTSPMVSILAGGTLGGTGNIVGAVNVANGGMIAPGNSIGTLNIAGNVNFAAGSIYQVEVNSAGQGDKLLATGTATLNGGTVQVLAQMGNYAPNTTYTILTANGGRTGEFTDVTSNLAFLTPSLAYDTNNVFLTLARNATFFCDLARTRNQQGVACALDRSPITSALVLALLNQTNAGALQAFDALSGEIHSSVQSALIDDSRFVRQALLGRLRQATYVGDAGAAALLGHGGPMLAYQAQDPMPSPALAYQSRKKAISAADFPLKAVPARPPDSDLTFWAQASGVWGRFDGDGNAAETRRTLGGFIGGFDRRFSTWHAGLAAGYTQSSISDSARVSSAMVDTAHLAGYAGGTIGAFNLRSGAAYAFHRVDASRTVLFPGFAESEQARYGAGTGQMFGELGYGARFGRVAVEPFVGAAFVSLRTNGFTETGGIAALDGAGSRQSVSYSTLGVRAASSFALASGMLFMPRVSVAWQHAFGKVTPTAALTFTSTAAGFTIAGVPIARDGALVEVGADLVLGPRTTLGLSYVGHIASSAQDHSASGRLSWRF